MISSPAATSSKEVTMEEKKSTERDQLKLVESGDQERHECGMHGGAKYICTKQGATYSIGSPSEHRHLAKARRTEEALRG
jgi:hypothetical protein